ncbi:hypothetical protein LCGC14_0845810 [marine sediment metagenome]|uniref:Uncharacterized protein n=1 Tax=marine sediment metagenome TaxID=412755 RepID=A0A0F9PBT6_9ZZZZ
MNEKQKEQARLRKQNQRDRERGNSVTLDSVTSSVTRPNRMGANGMIEMVENEYNPDELMPDGSKRYVGPFSDGCVLDRTTVPLPNLTLPVPKFTPVKTRLS